MSVGICAVAAVLLQQPRTKEFPEMFKKAARYYTNTLKNKPDELPAYLRRMYNEAMVAAPADASLSLPPPIATVVEKAPAKEQEQAPPKKKRKIGGDLKV